MFDLGAKVKISPFCWKEHRLGMLKHDPDLKEDSVFTIKRRGKLRLTFEETDVRIPLTWMVPVDGISVNQAGKRACRRDVDEAAKRAHKTGKSISMPYFYYSVGSSLLREIGMEARSEDALKTDGRRGLGGAFRLKNHPLTVFLVSYFNKYNGETTFWMGVTLNSVKFEDWMRDSKNWLNYYKYYTPTNYPSRTLLAHFPDLKVFREDDSKGPMSLDTHEGWDAAIDHIRQVCVG